MMHILKPAGRAWPLLILALAIAGCDSETPSEPEISGTPSEAPAIAPSFSTSFRGGIPFGVFHLPKEEYGTVYNGSMSGISPSYLLSYLEAARRSGTRLILNLSGGQNNYRNADGSFSLSKWKERVARYRGINFSSYVNDGTIIGHYLVDEPHDKSNWGGTTISPATLDEMARYSKQLWPTIPTIARTWPAYLKGSTYRYLDGAWAQYHERFGSIETWISNNVRDAKASGLSLVAGVNHLAGGTTSGGLRGYYDNYYSMGARELEAWGGALLNEPYVCAFLSWRHDADYMGRSDIKAVMGRLSEKARNHTGKSCRGTNGQTSGEEPTPPPEEPVGGVSPVPTSGISLSVTGWVQDGRHYMKLTWSGAGGSTVDLYRNGTWIRSTENDRKYTNSLGANGPATYRYRICERGSSKCSNEARVDL
jgi:hypothetical protein